MQTAYVTIASPMTVIQPRLPVGPLARSAPSAPVAGATRRLGKDQELCAEGAAATFFYKVVSGGLRTYRLLEDGRRQVDAFYLPGDIVGLEAREEHRVTAEAVCETTVIAYRRCSFEAASRGESEFVREIVAAILESLERARDHLLLLGCKSALEKIATFLLDMSRRENDEDAVALPMSRVDIADHLGLRIETVSRSLTELGRRRLIEMPADRRRIVLRNRAALRDLADGIEAVM